MLSELKVKNFKMFMLEKELIVRVPGEFMKVLASPTIGENTGSIIYGLGLKMTIIHIQYKRQTSMICSARPKNQ